MGLAIACALFTLIFGYSFYTGIDAANPDKVMATAQWALAATLIWGAVLVLGWLLRNPLRDALAGANRSRLMLLGLAIVPIVMADALSN